MSRYACRACGCPLDVEPGIGPVSAVEGGTYDYCPGTETHRHAVTSWDRMPEVTPADVYAARDRATAKA